MWYIGIKDYNYSTLLTALSCDKIVVGLFSGIKYSPFVAFTPITRAWCSKDCIKIERQWCKAGTNGDDKWKKTRGDKKRKEEVVWK